MGELIVEEKKVVVPGEIVAKGLDFLPSTGTYRLDENIIASRLGLVSIEGKVIKLIPLSGSYIPKAGDVIIGQVSDITMSGWLTNTNTAYTAVLNVRDATSHFIAKGADLTKYFSVGDFLATKIINVTSQMLVDLSTKGPGLKKLSGGQVISVEASKVPRIVGKAGSMVSMIKEATKCRIVVGQNGLVWLNGEPKAEVIAVNTIRIIERESHVAGLTERVQFFLDNAVKGMDFKEIQQEEEPHEEYSRSYPREERNFRGRDSYNSGRNKNNNFRRDSRGPQRRYSSNSDNGGKSN